MVKRTDTKQLSLDFSPAKKPPRVIRPTPPTIDSSGALADDIEWLKRAWTSAGFPNPSEGGSGQ